MRVRTLSLLALILWICASAVAQTANPLDRAYQALAARDYDTAAALFRDALTVDSNNVAARKDLAYTLLKMGQNEAARDEFAAVLRLTPADHHTALEYAFLCYETKQEAEARRTFARVARDGDPASRATAAQAFENVDRPLREGIARWQQALRVNPSDFSAHRELARLAEQRDGPALATSHYAQAWSLKPQDYELLLALGRVRRALKQEDAALATLLAASRCPEPRTAEAALELLPHRYPYPYEFAAALEILPQGVLLRREYAYLLLAMGSRREAMAQFERLAGAAPPDLLSCAQLGFLLRLEGRTAEAMPLLERVLQSNDAELAAKVRMVLKQDPAAGPPLDGVEQIRALGLKSLELGYLKDALHYLSRARAALPEDSELVLKLGWTYNMLHRDREALEHFALARRSPDPAIAREANQAWRNLSPEFRRVRLTTWSYPFFSSRWRDTFLYAQTKLEFKLGRLPIRPYLSARLLGDLNRRAPRETFAEPRFYGGHLGENVVILGAGASAALTRRLTAWFEAGTALRYAGAAQATRASADRRGGLSYTHGWGRMLGSSRRGWFAESANDLVYVSRYEDDVLAYAQNRLGWTFGPYFQAHWNVNLTTDSQRFTWANFVETGPGLRLRWPSLPRGAYFGASLLRGAYTVAGGFPYRPNYWDVRAGMWYAITR